MTSSEDSGKRIEFKVDGSYTFDADNVMTSFQAEDVAGKMLEKLKADGVAQDASWTMGFDAVPSVYHESIKRSAPCETCGSRVLFFTINAIRVKKKAFFEFKPFNHRGISMTEHTPSRCRAVKAGEEEPWS